MKGEIWKDIEGYEGRYMVSNLGRVKSLERMKWNGKGYQKIPEKILKGYDNGKGYLQVELCKDGKVEKPLVHRLVASAFCENPMGYTEVNHIDEDKANNRADNLEYCSRLYNMNYGTGSKRSAEKRSKPVFSVNKESGLITYWESIIEASRQTGISKGNICSCLKGKLNSAGNHYWFYADDNE